MKFSKLALIGIIPIVALIFFACQKADLKSPTVSSNLSSTDGVFDLSVPDNATTCTTSSTYCFSTQLTNHGGGTPGGTFEIYATINTEGDPNAILATSATLSSNGGDVCFSGLALAPGTYTVYLHYSHGNGNAQPQQGTFDFPLAVQAEADCGTTSCQTTGLTFTRTPIIVLADNLAPVAVNVTYTVTNCSTDQTFNNLKIQGGLVKNAGTPTLLPGGTGDVISFTASKNKGSANWILTGYFSLEPTEFSTFNVQYSVTKPCNNYLTGEWSVKNGPTPVISTDLLGTVSPNYMNRLRYECTTP
jgi:hypothetical protein